MLISLDNVGVWNLRVENLDRWYLGQETYMRIINPEENGETEFSVPSNVRFCGALEKLQKYVSTTLHIDLSLPLPPSIILMTLYCCCFYLQTGPS